MSAENWFEHPQYIPPQKLILTEAEVVSALRFAWKNIYNDYPSDNSLGILFAQTALETGRYKNGFHNNNLGHIKATLSYINLGGKNYFTMFQAGEIIGGKEFIFNPPHVQTWFRAYKTLIEGAEDYIRFVSQKTRYKTAWQWLVKGNPKEYSYALSAAGYYTASKERYTAGVIRLFDEFHRRKEELLSWTPPEESIEVTENEIISEEKRDTDPVPPEDQPDRNTTTLPPPSEESTKKVIIPPLPAPPIIKTVDASDSEIPDFKDSKKKTKGAISLVLVVFAGWIMTTFHGCENFFHWIVQ